MCRKCLIDGRNERHSIPCSGEKRASITKGVKEYFKNPEARHKASQTRIIRGLSRGANNFWYGKSRSGVLNPMFGVHRFGKDAPMYGRKHKEESKQKDRISLLKKWREDGV